MRVAYGKTHKAGYAASGRLECRLLIATRSKRTDETGRGFEKTPRFLKRENESLPQRIWLRYQIESDRNWKEFCFDRR